MNDRTLAFIIDGDVILVSRFDERTSAIFLSKPEVIDITTQNISEGWSYDQSKGFYVEIDGQEVIAEPESLL